VSSSESRGLIRTGVDVADADDHRAEGALGAQDRVERSLIDSLHQTSTSSGPISPGGAESLRKLRGAFCSMP